jgi:predicted DNA-binding transcriptional regulator AlpA
MKLLKINDLAKILCKSPVTIRVDVSRRPETLPPRLVMPGSNRVIWAESDVNEWLSKRQRTGEVA